MEKKNKVKEEKKIILIIEDDEVLLRALYVFFHDSDYTIASATDGETAIDMTKRLKPDIVLLDLLLPKMDGFRYLELVRSMPEFKDLPIIVLSNLGDKADIDRAKNLGANDYFIKANVDLEKLSEAIKEILK